MKKLATHGIVPGSDSTGGKPTLQTVRESPILFSSAMIRALLDGSKTQTRRVIKSIGDDNGCVMQEEAPGIWRPYRSHDGESIQDRDGNETPIQCPYGWTGDRLWVRETLSVVDCPWSYGPHYLYAEEAEQYYKMSLEDYDAGTSWAHKQGRDFWESRVCGMKFGTCPSIHMPRWASRRTLEIVSVKVQRIQEISPADARAEGLKFEHGNYWATELDGYPVARQAFEHLWDSINERRDGCSWLANPWVWCLSFRRII